MTEKEFKRLRDLAEAGKASAEELKQLEPYRVKRAILLAAGVGEQLKPITINTPKPLVKVNGVRMIDTLIDACIKAEIEEIYVVRGHLSEQFDILRYKYPRIRFIDNPAVCCCSDTDSIASVWKAKELLNENVYICDADFVVYKPEVIIRKYNYYSSVLGIPVERCEDDWCLIPDDQLYVSEKVFGGVNCYKMVGVFYWTKEDAMRLKDDVHRTFTEGMKKGRNLCWEDVPIRSYRDYWNGVPVVSYRDQYDIKIIPCSAQDIIEIDTWEELKAIDPAYRKVGGE